MTASTFNVSVQNAETAPPAARDLLKAVQGKFGFLPNMIGLFGNSPALLEGYLALAGAFDKSSFSPTERQIVLLATSFENDCGYCVAAHSAIAAMQKVDPVIVAALREGTPIADTRLEALRGFVLETVRSRGWPAPESVSRFTAAGYSPAQALEVVLGIGVKTISNYVNHLAGTPLDAAFAPVRWSKPACAAGCAR